MNIKSQAEWNAKAEELFARIGTVLDGCPSMMCAEIAINILGMSLDSCNEKMRKEIAKAVLRTFERYDQKKGIQ